MKKLVVLLAIIALSAPVFAAQVTVTATADGNNVTIGYTSDMAAGDPCLPVGIALKVAVDGGEISELVSYDQTEFPVYLDYAYTEQVEGDGFTNDPWEGHPLAAAEDAPGALNLDSLPVSEVIVCMGRLSDPPSPGPASMDNLVTLAIDCGGDGEATVSITEEKTYRGGIVSAKVGTVLDVVLPDPVVNPCGGGGCWADPNQQMGDANGDGKVNLGDLIALKQGFGQNAPDYNECVDFNRDGKVNLGDLIILKQNFGKVF